MSHDEKIDVHPLEMLEQNLSTQAEPASRDATEQPSTGFAVLSPTGFAIVSPTGFAII